MNPNASIAGWQSSRPEHERSRLSIFVSLNLIDILLQFISLYCGLRIWVITGFNAGGLAITCQSKIGAF